MHASCPRRSPTGLIGRSFTLLAAALVVVIASTTRDARAFFPTNVKTVSGLLGRSHEAITTNAITSFDQSTFAVTKLTSSMKQAIRDIADADANVDQDQ